MKTNWLAFGLCVVFFLPRASDSQTSPIVMPDKIDVLFKVDVSRTHEGYLYDYAVYNGSTAEQSVWIFDFHLPSSVLVETVKAPANWLKVVFKDSETVVRWMADTQDSVDGFKDSIRAGGHRNGFSFLSPEIPGIITFYAEGSAPLPSFSEGMAADDIPGYFDHTPYGPGVVGTVVGPVTPPADRSAVTWLDSLVSFKHRSVALGWLSDDKSRERECERTIRGRGWYKKHELRRMRNWRVDDSWDFDRDWNNGIVGVLDNRLEKAKQALNREDSVKARRDLQIFVMEVDLVYSLGEKSDVRSKKSDFRGKKSEVRGQKPVMTNEAYALLKYNAEYLIDRLPTKHRKGR